jgi:predicted AAA+ superfamily ATPase
VVFLTGPRQSGKTTLARTTFPAFAYHSLEDLQTRQEALEDPRGFLSRLEGASGIVIDEAQRAPELFSYLQGFVDEERAGPVILTGSQHFLLSDTINQSLAGRAAIIELLPFSYAELCERPARDPDELADRRVPTDETPEHELDRILSGGLYPRIHDRGLDPTEWLDGYLRTYIERDVRTLTNIGNLDTFARFVALCAGRSGQLLNMSALGADAGVDQSTARRWISLLRASYVLDLLQPYHRNFRKRIVKRPKLYFHDTGLMCHLLGITAAEQLVRHPLRGAVFETFVVSELTKAFLNARQRPRLFFWRDSRGREVDALVERGERLVPYEVKAGQTVVSEFLNGLDEFTRISAGDGGVLVYGGESSYLHRGHLICSWAHLS